MLVKLLLALFLALITLPVGAVTLPCSHSWSDGVTSGDSVESCDYAFLDADGDNPLHDGTSADDDDDAAEASDDDDDERGGDN